MIRELLSFIPSNNLDDPPRGPEPIPSTAPMNNSTASFPQIEPPYDIKDVINAVVDDNYFFEAQEQYAQNIVIGFARLDGKPVGIVANQPAFLAGI